MECFHQSMVEYFYLSASRSHFHGQSYHLSSFSVLARLLSRILHYFCFGRPLHRLNPSNLPQIYLAIVSQMAAHSPLPSQLLTSRLLRGRVQLANPPGFHCFRQSVVLLRAYFHAPRLPPSSPNQNNQETRFQATINTLF